MRKRTPAFLTFAALCLLILSGLSPALAQDAEPDGGPDAAPDQDAMMEAMAAAGALGEAHERMAESVGTWNMEIRMWMGGPEPSVAMGTSERSLILGGRVLVEEVSATMMGFPFSGYGLSGYDNVTGKHWATWNDDQSTGITTSWGTYDAEAGVYTFHGEMPDAMTGELKSYRSTVKYEDGKEIMDMYEMHDGQEVKTMEIVYSRK